jgi:hypothetical protein
VTRLLREKSSGLYYKGADGWTADKRKAFNFKDNASAIACGRRLKRGNLELILAFARTNRDVAFPLHE